MTFDPVVVAEVVRKLQHCKQTAHLGKPVKVLELESDHFPMFGVGVEFTGGVRNAVVFKDLLANENCAETKRRLEEWVAS